MGGRTRRSAVIAILATIAMTLSGCAAVIGGGGDPTASSCPGTYLIGARGSGEAQDAALGVGQTLVTFFASVRFWHDHPDPGFTSEAPPMPFSDVIGVDYPAVNVLNVTALQYRQSRNAGVLALRNMLTLKHAQCPDAEFILAGFSHGADVVGSVFDSHLLPHDIFTKVYAVALFGDPHFNPRDKAFDRGTAIGLGGFLGHDRKVLHTQHPTFSGVAESWCNTLDPVCDAGRAALKDPGALALCAVGGNKGLCPHLLYPSGATDEAGHDVARAGYRKATPPPTSPPPTNPPPTMPPGSTCASGEQPHVSVTPNTGLHDGDVVHLDVTNFLCDISLYFPLHPQGADMSAAQIWFLECAGDRGTQHGIELFTGNELCLWNTTGENIDVPLDPTTGRVPPSFATNFTVHTGVAFDPVPGDPAGTVPCDAQHPCSVVVGTSIAVPGDNFNLVRNETYVVGSPALSFAP